MFCWWKLLASCPSEPRRDAQMKLSLACRMFGTRSQTARHLHFQPERSPGLRGGPSQEVTLSLLGLVPASRLQAHTLALMWRRHQGCFIRKWSGARQPDLGVPVRRPGHSLFCYKELWILTCPVVGDASGIPTPRETSFAWIAFMKQRGKTK